LKRDRSVGAAAVAAEVMIAEAKQRRRQNTNKDGGEGAFSAFEKKHANVFFFLKKTDL
jgi:hypothetical protein